MTSKRDNSDNSDKQYNTNYKTNIIFLSPLLCVFSNFFLIINSSRP